MKKILLLLALVFAITFVSIAPPNLFTPITEVQASVFSGGGIKEGTDKAREEVRGTGLTTSNSLITVILGLVKATLPYVGVFAFVGLIYAGFLYVTAFADDQTETAKNIFKWSALGIVIIFIAYSFVATLLKFGNT